MAPLRGGAKSGGALPNLRILCPQTAFFGPKRPRNPVITAKLRQTVPTLHVRLDFTVSKSPLVPFNSTICPRNGPKRRQNLRNVHQHPETKHGPYLGLCGSKSDSEGTYSTRKPPLFVVSKPENRPTRGLDPRTSGHLVEPEGSPARARRGPTVGPLGSPG